MRKIALLKRLNSTVRTGLLAGALVAAGPVQGQDAPDLDRMTGRAEAGDAEAMTALGNAHANGVGGLRPDPAEAFKWYRRAADKGFAPAQFNVGLAYELGRGVTADEKQAFKFYLAAAEQGFAPAQFNVGNMYAAGRGVGQDHFEANLWFKQAADSGIVEAQFNLGFAYEAGNGVKKDDAQAARWYRQAAERGYARAQYNFALLLEDGRGVARDLAAAASFYRAAAEQNFAPAQVNYGLILSEGRPGVASDPVQGLVWLSRAVQGGANPDARDALARRLSPEQLAAVTRQLGGASVASSAPSSNQSVASAPGAAPASANLVEQLREQSRRLAARVESLTADKETAERQSSLLASEIRDLRQELQQARAGAGAQPAAAPAELTRLQGEVAVLTARLEKSADALREAEQAGGQLAEANRRLQQEKDAAALSTPTVGAEAARQTGLITTLQRDNARLNAEVKRATIELLALNTQLRALRSQPASPATEPEQTAAEVSSARELAAKLEAENRRLSARVNELESKASAPPRPADDQALARLQEEVRSLQNDKKDLEQWSQSLEKTLNEKTAAAAAFETTLADLRQRQAGLEKQLSDSARPEGPGADVARLLSEAAQLTAANKALQTELTNVRTDASNVAALRDSLIQANSRIAGLDRELTAARQQGENAGAALTKSSAAVSELTAANDLLERELATAKQGATEAANMRDELARLRRGADEAVRLGGENDRLKQDLARLQVRLTEAEKQSADVPTVRTRGNDDNQRVQTELAEANRTVEKLNTTVAELTVENQKLEQDLENAQKSASAALAAQSQAVSAANPDAFRMEISTLQARVKELDAQAEEERTNAAREISTLAAQLQRTRETNRSLTEANRALVSAKESDTASVRDEAAQLQARIRELTATAEEFRRQAQQQTAEVRSLTLERETLRAQLADAQKVATVLPGMADEKAALQERLEAVGAQLVQLQREHADLEKVHAELNQQAATSQQVAEKAQADLGALQTRVAEADRADEAHTSTVAELTQTNSQLEREREDMRRLVDSYRADIARLTQVARTAEQLKADAERSGQQNVDAVTAQLAQLRRELEAARVNQARLTEAHSAQDRERIAAITQLRTENAALAARLNQAQGTLDQIAAAARLGTPASTIASGGTPVVRTAPSPAAEVRFHMVAEGDSLSRISLRYYGTPSRWQEIFQANRDVLQGSSALRIGMQLRIP